MVLLQLGKEIQPETIGELTSSSPESGESSLSNGHSLSEVISDWKRDLEEKNCLLREKISLIHSLEDRLKEKDMEVSDVHDRCKSVELDRDKNCQMVSTKHKKNCVKRRKT
jgi:predicted nuclease with TOPRIM domain